MEPLCFSLNAENRKSNSAVEDFVAVVKGGDSETITQLATKNLPTQKLMQQWGEAVYYNPDFIHTKVAYRPNP